MKIPEKNIILDSKQSDKTFKRITTQRYRKLPWQIHLVVQQAYSNRFHQHISSSPCILSWHQYILVDIQISILQPAKYLNHQTACPWYILNEIPQNTFRYKYAKDSVFLSVKKSKSANPLPFNLFKSQNNILYTYTHQENIIKGAESKLIKS